MQPSMWLQSVLHSGHVRCAPNVTAVKAAIQRHYNKRCPAGGCSWGCRSKQGLTAQKGAAVKAVGLTSLQ